MQRHIKSDLGNSMRKMCTASKDDTSKYKGMARKMPDPFPELQQGNVIVRRQHGGDKVDKEGESQKDAGSEACARTSDDGSPYCP